jgi:hypothetical protein
MLTPEKMQEQADILTAELIDAMIENDQRATGITIAAIRNDVTSTGFTIYGPPHVGALEYGRRPTSNSGSGDLYFKILEWVQNKAGVVMPDGVQNSRYTLEERIAKRITYFIHKSGTYLYRRGETYNGQRDPLSRVFTPERIQAIADAVGTAFAQQISSEIFREMKTLAQ